MIKLFKKRGKPIQSSILSQENLKTLDGLIERGYTVEVEYKDIIRLFKRPATESNIDVSPTKISNTETLVSVFAYTQEGRPCCVANLSVPPNFYISGLKGYIKNE